jgi:hypothetical protein
MSPQAKVDLGAKAEAMLASWPAPSSDDAVWENRAAKIVAAATNASRASDAELAALFAKPALDAEPGEVESSTVSATSARSSSGVKAMSQDSNDGSSAKPSIPPASATNAAVSKRPSLKELAARASQANAAGTPSIRPTGSIPPPSAETLQQDKLSRPSSPAPSIPPPKASIPPPRPVEAGKEDSGRVDLNAINQAATPAQIAAAEVAKPAAHDLVSEAVAEDKPAAANDTSDGAKVKNISEARAKKTKKSEAAKTNESAAAAETASATATATATTTAKKEEEGGGGKWAALVAILAIAAGAFFMLRNKQPPPQPPVAAVQPKQEAQQAAVDTKKIEEPKPASTGLSIDSLPAAEPAESAKAAPVKVAAVAPVETAAPAPTPEPVAPTAVPTATGAGKVGDLSSEMAKAVGGSTDKPVNADDATPAAGKSGSQTIPEQPSQGAANAAVRPLAANAKPCVAGADDVSYASVTFSSAGTVSNVSVSGWASKNGKADCIKSALKGANVGPFAKPTFTISVPIRP